MQWKKSSHSISILLAGMQWLFFLFTNTVLVPLSVGHALGLADPDIAASMQRSFILTGLLCIVQALWGHRFALMDGPAGVWWGLVLGICSSAPAMGMDASAAAASLTGGFLLSGVVAVALTLLGFLKLLQRVFTPIVMGVYLLLLTFQLANTFFKGMIGYNADGKWDLQLAGLSMFIISVVSFIHMKGKGKLGQFSLLGGMIVGWIAYTAFFGSGGVSKTVAEAGTTLIGLWLPWGKPVFDPGIVLVGLLAGLVNMTNTITSLIAAGRLYQENAEEKQFVRSLLFTNVFSIIGGCFGLIPFGTFASSVGFLENTKVLSRSALITGAAMLILVGIVPALSGWLTGLPISVGSAVLFVAYLQMFGTAIRSFNGTAFNAKTIYRVALPILTGIGIMNVPVSAFADFPPLLTPIASNGLVVGVILAIVMEKIVRWENYETTPSGTDVLKESVSPG
ncbi:uracil/xanthine transporter [Paenibacillus sp. N4]|uniref:uracil/xanthine transporter n=1 Tax=Paenibacillus vietnamensis TaxID=2590547 RepID=UPI001CD0AAFF|nr:uracil/xanthine transporter [Paenibacillus vietnamensis]MCA0754236.1 uracil/xanthine transporter [Paenibacillus vietnamensis]